MIIEFGAFANCCSLKEIHFEKCKEAINTNIYHNASNDFKIIVHDKMLKQELAIELRANFSKVIKYSDYIQLKIDKLKNSNIILSIIYLEEVVSLLNNTEYINTIISIIKLLADKYKIDEFQKSYIQFLINKKQEIQNES